MRRCTTPCSAVTATSAQRLRQFRHRARPIGPLSPTIRAYESQSGIFKAYDIRGPVSREIDEEVVRAIGAGS